MSTASRLGKLFQRTARRQVEAAAIRMGVVTAIRPDGVRVRFLGEESSPGRSYKVLAPEALRYGDTVVCLPVGGTWVVLGPALAQPRVVWYDDLLWDSVSAYIYSGSGSSRVNVAGMVGVIKSATAASAASSAGFQLNHALWPNRNPALSLGVLGPSPLTAAKSTVGIDMWPTSQIGHHAKFWYDAADGPYWFASLGDGVSFSEVSTGVLASTSVWHHFRIELDGKAQTPVAKYYIDGELVATLTAYFPPATGVTYGQVYVETTEAVIKNLWTDYFGLVIDRGF